MDGMNNRKLVMKGKLKVRGSCLPVSNGTFGRDSWLLVGGSRWVRVLYSG